MPTGTTRSLGRLGAALLGAGLLAACTIDDRFTFADPVQEVTLVEIQTQRAPGSSPCAPGTTIFWGTARNTGDTFLYEVQVNLDVFGPAGELLGRFSDSVVNGGTVTDEEGNVSPSTTLDLDELGHFTVCTAVPWGAAARAEATFGFVIFESEE